MAVYAFTDKDSYFFAVSEKKTILSDTKKV